MHTGPYRGKRKDIDNDLGNLETSIRCPDDEDSNDGLFSSDEEGCVVAESTGVVGDRTLA